VSEDISAGIGVPHPPLRRTSYCRTLYYANSAHEQRLPPRVVRPDATLLDGFGAFFADPRLPITPTVPQWSRMTRLAPPHLVIRRGRSQFESAAGEDPRIGRQLDRASTRCDLPLLTPSSGSPMRSLCKIRSEIREGAGAGFRPLRASFSNIGETSTPLGPPANGGTALPTRRGGALHPRRTED